MTPHAAHSTRPTRAGPVNPTGIDLLAAAQSYDLALAGANKAPRTREVYGDVIAALDRYLAGEGMPRTIEAIRREHIESFLAHQLANGRAPASVSIAYRSLRTFFAWAVEEDELLRSPMERMKPIRVPFVPPPIVATGQMARLFRVCEGKDLESRRDMAILRLLASTGMRRGECVALQVADLDLATRSVVIRAGTSKSRRQRVARYGAKTAAALDRYLRVRRGHRDAELPALWLGRRGPLTDNGFLQLVRRRGNAAGIPNLHPHTLRHTFAHLQLGSGESEQNVMEIGGWVTRGMLDRYGSIAKAERAQAAYRDPLDVL